MGACAKPRKIGVDNLPECVLSLAAAENIVMYPRSVGPWRSLVSASVWGAEGREFESHRPDH